MAQASLRWMVAGVLFVAGHVFAAAAPTAAVPAVADPALASTGGNRWLVASEREDAPLPYSSTPAQTQASRSDAEKRLAADSSKFRSVVFGGFLNSMITKLPVAALTCYARYANNKQARDQCLTAGAVAITIDGVSKGYAAAKLQEAGQNRVRAIESVTADMSRDNARMQDMIDASETVLNESQARLKKLREDVQAKRIASDQARAEARRDQDNLQNLNQALADSRTTRDEYVKTAASFQGTPAERRNLDAEIAAMNAKVKTLENNVRKLTNALVPFTA